jgi:enterochelin esterase-like enzyme
MKRILSIAVFLLAVMTASAQSKSRIVTDSLYSSVLQCTKEYDVYLPKHYDENSDKSYPVLYLLHGYSGDNHNWNKRGRVREVLEYLLNAGEICEMIVVMPDADADIPRAEHGYFNHPHWRYEDYFFTEFLPCVEKRYRIKADKGHRAIAGLSMGGGGTVSYAQKHPELFCAAYAMSALMENVEGRLPHEDPKVNTMRQSAKDNSCVAFVRNASEDVRNQLRTVRWFVDCGDDDYLLGGNLDFIQEMRKAQIPFEFRVREGAHVWEYWHSALYICLPFVTRTFGK